MYGFKVRLSKMWRTEVKNMEKKTLLIIGLIGGIIAAVGVFLPWSAVADGSGSNEGKVIILGGVLALIGGLAALATSMKSLGYLIPVGGLVGILGWIWAGNTAGFGNLTNFSYGFWVCLVGAIIALIGTLGVKK
jgi:hypothetical protein